MFVRIAGYFSILCGVVWLLKPEMLRGWLHWKAGGKLFWLAMGVFFFPLFNFGVKTGFAGILGVFLVIFLIKQTIGKTLGEWLGRVPLQAFQAIGLLSVISGIVLVLR